MKLSTPILLLGFKRRRRVALVLRFLPSYRSRIKWRSVSSVLSKRFDGVFFIGAGYGRPYLVLHSGASLSVPRVVDILRAHLS